MVFYISHTKKKQQRIKIKMGKTFRHYSDDHQEDMNKIVKQEKKNRKFARKMKSRKEYDIIVEKIQVNKDYE